MLLQLATAKLLKLNQILSTGDGIDFSVILLQVEPQGLQLALAVRQLLMIVLLRSSIMLCRGLPMGFGNAPVFILQLGNLVAQLFLFSHTQEEANSTQQQKYTCRYHLGEDQENCAGSSQHTACDIRHRLFSIIFQLLQHLCIQLGIGNRLLRVFAAEYIGGFRCRRHRRQQLALGMEGVPSIPKLLQLGKVLPNGLLGRHIFTYLLCQGQRLFGSVTGHLGGSELLGILQLLIITEGLLMIFQPPLFFKQCLLLGLDGGNLILQATQLIQLVLHLLQLRFRFGQQAFFTVGTAFIF